MSPAPSARWCAALLLLSAACGRSASPEGTSKREPSKRALGRASEETGSPTSKTNTAVPSAEFVAPKAWTSWREGVKPVAAPDLSQETWRVFANREQPIQRETPVWQPLPAEKVVELHMPEGSRYRCLVNPVEVTPLANDWGTELEAWTLVRRLLCSSDDWQTWTEYPHRLILSVDGTRTVAYASEAALRERTASGQIYQTTVLFRSDKEERQATTGPARIIASSGPGD